MQFEKAVMEKPYILCKSPIKTPLYLGQALQTIHLYVSAICQREMAIENLYDQKKSIIRNQKALEAQHEKEIQENEELFK